MKTIPCNPTIQEEGITLFGKNPNEILSAFKKAGLADQGYSIAGRIIPNQATLINHEGQNQELFDGERMYSATFIRRS